MSRTIRAALATVLVLTPASGVAQQHAQASGDEHMAHGAAVVAPDGRLRTVHDRDERAVRIQAGPFDLAPSHDAGAMQVVRGTAGLPTGAWFTGFRVRVLDASGAELPASLIHHVNVLLPGRRDLFTSGLYRLAAAGAETAPIELPWPLALALERGESLLVVVMLHNAGHSAVDDVTVELVLDYRPFGRLPHVRVETIYLDAVEHGLGSHTWDLPAGASQRSWEGSPAVPGRILALGGHMHRYGTRILLEDVTAGVELWDGVPDTAPDGEIRSVPRGQFLTRLGIPLDTAHTYRVTVFYENPTGQTIPDGAMGTIAGVFKPARRAEWPAPDRRDPFYRRDLRAVTSADAN